MTKRFPLVTAHTGCMNTPANSLESVNTGIKLDADIIEDDVRVTKDGVPVLAHDDLLHVQGGVQLRLSQLSYADLIEARRIYGEDTFCPLEEMLGLIRASGKIANLDLKQDECIAPVAGMVKKLGMLDQVFLSGCGAARARKVQKDYPELKKLLNVHDGYFSASAEDGIRLNCEDAIAASCFGLNFDYCRVGPELLEYASSKRLPVYIWTVNDETDMERFAEMGVHSITTRNVAALMKLKGQE